MQKEAPLYSISALTHAMARPLSGSIVPSAVRLSRGGYELIYYILKIAITTILIIAISEISKRNSFIGAVLASIPLVSVLAMFWLYIDTGDATKVSNLSSSIFWLVLPSLALFLTLPILLKFELHFYWAIAISIGLTSLCYLLMLAVLNYFEVKL